MPENSLAKCTSGIYLCSEWIERRRKEKENGGLREIYGRLIDYSTGIIRTHLGMQAMHGCGQYTGCSDVTESVVTIRSPFCGYNTIQCVELNGGDLSCYSAKTESVSFKKMPIEPTITDLPTEHLWALSRWQTFLRVLPTRRRQKSTGADMEENGATVTLYIVTYVWCVVVCESVCVDVCWSQPLAPQKRLNRSTVELPFAV